MEKDSVPVMRITILQADFVLPIDTEPGGIRIVSFPTWTGGIIHKLKAPTVTGVDSYGTTGNQTHMP